MKNFLWCLLSLALAYGSLYGLIWANDTYAFTTPFDTDYIPLVLPLFFIVIYLIGKWVATSWSKDKTEANHMSIWSSAGIYAIELLAIVAVSIIMGKLFDLWEVTTWFAAILIVSAPSAQKVRRLINRVQMENKEE